MHTRFTGWNYILLGAGALLAGPAHAQWIEREVLSVKGTFSDLAPQRGFEVGLGTSHIEWGQSPPGSFRSTLNFNEYDAWPNFDQEWFWGGGQSVRPGQQFVAGSLTFRNGSALAGTASAAFNVDLNTYTFGSQFPLNGPLVQLDTLSLRIRETPDTGVDPRADADFIYFPGAPSLGSMRVYEGESATFPIYGTFGNFSPTTFRFGPAGDSDAGFLSPSVFDNPFGSGPIAAVDLDARDGFNAIGLTLDAGEYSISLRDGVYKAWSAWSETSDGCTINCTQGWLNFYGVFNHQTGQGVYVENGIGTPTNEYDFGARSAYGSPEAALAAARPYTFVLDDPATVEIAIPDCDGCFVDNRGGLSLLVDRIPGRGPADPLPPTIIDNHGGFVFVDVPSRRWYDPPLVSGYQFETTGDTLFTEVGMPPLDVVTDADGTYLVTSALGSQSIAAGANLIFSSPVNFFTVSGISPLLEGANPSAFPVYVVFNQSTASFTMTPIPEPATFTLVLITCVASCLARLQTRAYELSQETIDAGGC